MKLCNIKNTLVAISIGFAVQSALAGSITDINVSSLPDDQRVIKITFDKDVVKPADSSFVTVMPPRIALDFSGTKVQLPQPILEYSDPLIRQIITTQNDDNTRILLGLGKPGQYTAEIRGNEVWVYVSEAAKEAEQVDSVSQTSAVGYRQAEVSAGENIQLAEYNVQSVSFANIDFRKGANNTGIVELIAPDFIGKPSIIKSSDRIVVTLKNYLLPVQAQRRLEVGDFSTPISSITMRRIGNNTQIVIRNQGGWDMQMQSENGRFSFEVTPKENISEQGLLSGISDKKFKGHKISLDFQDIELRTVLQILAQEAGVNIIASDSVNGKMTIAVRDIPWDQALDLVMQTHGLGMRRHGNVINIAPSAELFARDKAVLRSQQEVEDLSPLISQTFQLKYKNADEFFRILRLDTVGGRDGDRRNTLLSSRGSTLIDPATNTLIVTDNHVVIKKFQKLIEELDVPIRQVMIEARIVEANDGFSRNIGMKFGSNGGSLRGGRVGFGTNLDSAYQHINGSAIGSVGAGNSGVTGVGEAGGGAGAAEAAGAVAAAGALFSPNITLPGAASSIALVGKLASTALGLELSLLQEQDKAKLISNPRVVTQDRKEANIASGTEIPYQEATENGATVTTFKQAVLGLTVTPSITPDGQVIMDVKINKDSPQDCRTSVPCVSTQQLQTNAMVEDGGTLIIGGIYVEEESSASSKVPVLGDIPIVGNLFKSRTKTTNRRELLIFITPRIMDHTGSTLRY